MKFSPPANPSLALIVAALALQCASCEQHHGDGVDAHVTKLGSFEVTARLVEVPPKAIVDRKLYDYAAVLKYEVVQVHRGDLKPGAIIYIAHYNPIKPRSSAADKRVKSIGGNIATFVPGHYHRLALEAPLDDHYMGGIVNEYHTEATGTLYWAVWTNAADKPKP